MRIFLSMSYNELAEKNLSLALKEFGRKFFAVAHYRIISVAVDTQVLELMSGTKWEKQTLVRTSVNSGFVYITQFENNPGNFVRFHHIFSHWPRLQRNFFQSYFANNGMICNHASSNWAMISGEQYLYKVCTPMGHRGYPSTALSFIRDGDPNSFQHRDYTNFDLTYVSLLFL